MIRLFANEALGLHHVPTLRLSWSPLQLFALYAVLTLAYRFTAVLYYDLNWDEALYRLIGNSLVSGHAPYTEFWDRKPVGIFLIAAAIQIAFGKSLIAFRLATSFAVALSAFLLALNARKIIPSTPQIGTVAGILYIVYSTHNGGEGANTELFYVPAGLAGLLIVLRAATTEGARALALALAAGLLMGAAVQIKQVAIFDILAYAMIYLLTRVDNLSLPHLLRHLGIAVATAIGILIPTLLIMAWYVVIGEWRAYYDANFAANIGMVEDESSGLNISGLIVGLRGFNILFIGTALTVLAGPFLARTSELRRALLAIFCWLAAMVISLVFLRRFADHFFLEVLPSVALATAFGMALSVRAWMPVRLQSPVVLTCVGLIAIWSGARQFNTDVEVLWRRHVDGIAHWGDRTATVAAAIRGRVQGPNDVYIFGRLLGVHELTGTVPQTQYPFSMHLFAEYAPVDGKAEIRRILANSPRFIVFDDNWLKETPGSDAQTLSVFDAMHDALSRHYVVDGRVEPFKSWGGGAVGGQVGATVFRRSDTPAFQATIHLQYDTGT